jgi:(E)-4-hydroxy-3-methylbut-2-enyl-diphosphate synthase
MTTTKTHDINAMQQIPELTAFRLRHRARRCSRQEDADALATIAKKPPIPPHRRYPLSPIYIFAAIDAGCCAVEVNPGNIPKFDGSVREVAKAALSTGIPLPIGAIAGSLDKR